MTRVKVCGLCDREAVRAASEAGADMIGLHFCPSRRRVSPERARAILSGLRSRPLVVGVFIDPSEVEVEEVVRLVGLDAVQLHGSEAPGFRSPVQLIKALKVREGRVPDAEGWPDPLLLDSWSANQRGGTGQAWPWEVARPLAARRQVIVAGGLRPDTVAEVVHCLRPWGVDVSSGVESAPGIKDPELVFRFVQAVRDADRELSAFPR